MKPFVTRQDSVGDSARVKQRGFTLPELLVAIAVFSMVLIGVVIANLYGLKMFRITETKLNVTENARKVMSRITQEVRSCRATAIGNVNAGTFEALLDGEVQQGSALLIRPSTNSSDFIIYFVNPGDQTFRRTTSSPGSSVILADAITNTLVFSARDYSGTVLTNTQNNRVIHLNLEAYQPESFGRPAEYYQLETSATRRALD